MPNSNQWILIIQNIILGEGKGQKKDAPPLVVPLWEVERQALNSSIVTQTAGTPYYWYHLPFQAVTTKNLTPKDAILTLADGQQISVLKGQSKKLVISGSVSPQFCTYVYYVRLGTFLKEGRCIPEPIVTVVINTKDMK